MRELRSGENSTVDCEKLKVAIKCEIATEQLSELDVSAFLLSGNGKVRGDADFIFYNQPKSPDNALAFFSQNYNSQYFDIDLTLVADDIQKIAFVITSPVAFSHASLLNIKIENHMSFSLKTDAMQEKSLILAELYRHKGNWKFRAQGQGFSGGLAPLATSYGVDIGGDSEPETNKTASKPLSTAPASPESSPPSSPSPRPSVQLGKTSIDLTKAGEKATISLAKNAKLTAKLQWDTQADLDLYCFYVDVNNNEDKVYYRKLGDLNSTPFIKLLGDSQVAGEEVLEISRPENIKYALICAYSALSNGVGSFHSYKARVVVTDNDKQEVTSHLAHKDPFSYWVAFALIDFTNVGEITINNVETYSNKKTFADQFKQRTGEKPSSLFNKTKANVNGVNSYDPERSPHLFKEGDFMMSVGEREFK